MTAMARRPSAPRAVSARPPRGGEPFAASGARPEGYVVETPRESLFFEEIFRQARLESCVVLIERRHLGERADEFGSELLRSLLFVLAGKETKPASFVLLAEAVSLACEGSPALPALDQLEADGVTLLICGASLNHLRLRAALRAGMVANMHDIAETLIRSHRVITL